MACIINASTSNGLVNSADGSGIVKLQSAGKTTNALAWVNFNGTGTVAIRSSYNVSSITDNGTGNYTVNFATALSDANYAVACSSRPVNASGAITVLNGGYLTAFLQTASAFRVQNQNYAGTTADTDYAYVTIFGN